MRRSAISSRVKSCVSSSTLAGSLFTVAGRWAVAAPAAARAGVELHRKTLEKDFQKEAEAPGIAATLRELARSLSTVALTRYAIAGGEVMLVLYHKMTVLESYSRSVVCMIL